MGKILYLESHPDFEYVKVFENYNPKTRRKVRKYLWIGQQLKEYKVAVFKPISGFISTSSDMDDDFQSMSQTIKCDIYILTGNVDKFNNVYEYVYDRTIEK